MRFYAIFNFHLILDLIRSFSIENAMDDVAYHKLRQKLSYLLEFRGKLDEESWRVGVDVGLIFSYFKVLLEFLMNQITESATHLADVKHQLMSNQECLQTTKSSLAVSQAEFHALHDQTDVFRVSHFCYGYAMTS